MRIQVCAVDISHELYIGLITLRPIVADIIWFVDIRIVWTIVKLYLQFAIWNNTVLVYYLMFVTIVSLGNFVNVIGVQSYTPMAGSVLRIAYSVC